jgi:hypothetical protein
MPSTNGHGPKMAVLYARVLGEEQARKGYSLPDQRHGLSPYPETSILEKISWAQARWMKAT